MPKYFMQLVKGDTTDTIPDAAMEDVVTTLVNELFVSESFKQTLSKTPPEHRKSVSQELLTLFFASKPEGALFVEIPEIPSSVTPPKRVSGTIVQVPSATEAGKEYDVTIQGGRAVACTCKGFEHRAQCRHLREGERVFDAQRFGRSR